MDGSPWIGKAIGVAATIKGVRYVENLPQTVLIQLEIEENDVYNAMVLLYGWMMAA